MHSAVAAGLLGAYGDDPAHAADIAHHHREAGQIAIAARYYEIAGETGLTRGAPAEAEAMLEQARALHDRLGAPALARVTVWRGIAQARFALGKLRETDMALRRLCELAGAPLPEDAGGIWRAALRQAAEHVARKAGVASRLGLAPRGEAERALDREILAGLCVQEIYVWLAEPPIIILLTLWGLNLEEAVGARIEGDFRAGMAFLLSYTPLHALGARYLALAARDAAPGTLAELDCARIETMMQLHRGSWSESARCAERVLSLARAYRDDLRILQALFLLQLAVTGLDEHRRVLSICGEMERVDARVQNPRYVTLGRVGQAAAHLQLGDLVDAEDAVEARSMFHRVARRFPLAEPIAWLWQGRRDWSLGQNARAARSLRRGLYAGERVSSRHERALLHYWTGCFAQTSEGAPHVPERAEFHLRASLALFERLDSRWEVERVRAALRSEGAET